MRLSKCLLLFGKSSFRTATRRESSRFDSKKRLLKYGTLTGLIAVPAVSYFSLDDRRRRQVLLNIGGVERFSRSATIGTIICIDYWWTLRSLDETDSEYAPRLESVHRRCAQRILQGCLRNGGLYIKFGQGLVNLDHLLPKEYVQTLKVLQDKCLQRRENEVKRLFEEDFGMSFTEIFESFEEEPIAAASLAQVFKAKLKDGTDVAVKAQYIDLRDRFHGDINTVDFLLSSVAWVFPKYDFKWILEKIKKPLELELDFTCEGRNAEKCAEQLSGLGYVYVPKVFWKQTTKRILTTEFIDGIKISETEALLKNGLSLVDVDNKLFTTFAEQIFHTGFIHADPHPGNIFVRKKKDGSAELVLLDHGLYETLPSRPRINLSNLWRAIVMNNHQDMKKYAEELGITNDLYRLFCIALAQRYVPPEDNSERDLIKQFFGMQIVSSPKTLSKEERNQMVEIHDRLLEVFKNLPGELLLVCRNLNAVRAIAKSHGNPVNRHQVMSHCATRRLFSLSADRSVLENLKSSYLRLIFEFKLWCDGVKQFVLSFYFNRIRKPAAIDNVTQVCPL